MTPIDLATLEEVTSAEDEGEVREAVRETDYSNIDLMEATRRVAKLLIFKSPAVEQRAPDFPNRNNTAFEQWIDACRSTEKEYHRRILVTWALTMRGDYSYFPLFLFNRDYKRSREVLHMLLEHEKAPPPYFSLIFPNVFNQTMGFSHTELNSMTRSDFSGFIPLYKHVMSTQAIDEWIAKKKQSLRFYGGETNTILGYYDPIVNRPDTGIEFFNRNAALRVDVGGGFNTSEIERLFGCPFISADIRSPSLRTYDGDLVIRQYYKNSRHIIADDKDRDHFLDQQDKIEWLQFDVFKHSFPDAASYAFTSTGFMTSTVRARKKAREHLGGTGLGAISTSFYAIMRVMEKVAQGKDVDLFTLQRATSRIYKYKTVLLQWRGGRLARLITTDDPTHHGPRWSDQVMKNICKAIDPDRSAYAAYMS